MRDLLPDELVRLIHDRFVAGVADAEAKFDLSEGDEDSLTGALGNSISMPETLTYSDGRVAYEWRSYYRKIRGRGPGAPEKPTGADGIFQIEVTDEHGNVLRQKGLPFQAKKRWTYADRKLVEQAANMMDGMGGGIVIDYAERGNTACDARAVIGTDGGKKSLRKNGKIKSLGQVLRNDFVECKVGINGLYYDPDEKAFRTMADTELAPKEMTVPSHVVGSAVHRRRL